MVTRRRVVAFCAGVLVSPSTFAQPAGKIWRVGFLAVRRLNFSDPDFAYAQFVQGMRELGYVEGRNLKIEWRSGQGSVDLVPKRMEMLLALAPKIKRIAYLYDDSSPSNRASGKLM